MEDPVDKSELNGGPESGADSNHHASTCGRGPKTLPDSQAASADGSAPLHSETLAPRSALPPLLLNLGERAPEALQYLGTSFGLTEQLFNFWGRSQYKPVYVRQTASDITGEHSFQAAFCALSLVGMQSTTSIIRLMKTLAPPTRIYSNFCFHEPCCEPLT